MYLSAAGQTRPRQGIIDEGGDLPRDIVLFNKELEATITPRHGGRIESLFARTPESDIIAFVDPMLGRRFRGRFPGLAHARGTTHGAWCDIGGEEDRYSISHVQMGPDFALAVMVNEEKDSALCGARKAFLLPASGRHILVCYQLPGRVEEFETDVRLAGPASTLRIRSHPPVLPVDDDVLRIGEGETSLWVARAHDEATTWISPGTRITARETHVRIHATSRHFHLLLGVGLIDDAAGADPLRRDRALIHAEDDPVWGPTTTTGVWLLKRRPEDPNAR